MEDRHLPSSYSSHTAVLVDVSGAEITEPADPEGERDIYLPKHTEWISHIAIDIGGSLIKVVYFTRSSDSTSSGTSLTHSSETSSGSSSPSRPNGILTPKSLSKTTTPPSVATLTQTLKASSLNNNNSDNSNENENTTTNHLPAHRLHHHPRNKRSSISSQQLPGGRINFTKFETDAIDSCISFIDSLIVSSSVSHNVDVEHMRKVVKIMATGGGAYLFYERLAHDLRVEVRREEEMDCLITGLQFACKIPNEVFYYSDELVYNVSHKNTQNKSHDNTDLERPSPDPPQYSVLFDDPIIDHHEPCLLVNIGSGVSIVKVDQDGRHERVSGTSLGGGTLWGLLSMLTGATTFDEMLQLSEKGNNENVDLLVGDIYGTDFRYGLKSSTIASSFGKVFRKGQVRRDFKPEDIAKSLLYAVSNNIGQIAYMNAEKHNISRIYFSGCFIRGHAATISTLSYAIRFWSKGSKRALFLRHEGYLGSIGAWLKNIEEEIPDEE